MRIRIWAQHELLLHFKRIIICKVTRQENKGSHGSLLKGIHSRLLRGHWCCRRAQTVHLPRPSSLGGLPARRPESSPGARVPARPALGPWRRRRAPALVGVRSAAGRFLHGPPARSRRAPSAPHRQPDADSATPLAGEAAPAQGCGGSGRPGEGSSGTEAERGRKGGGAVGNGDAQRRGWPRSNPSEGGWRTAKARGTAWLGAWNRTPPKTIYLGALGCLDLGTPMFTLPGPQRLQEPKPSGDIGRACSCSIVL